MSEAQLYSLAYVQVNGQLLSEEASVSVKRATGGQIAKTVAKGFAGISPGAKIVTISVKSMAPAAGLEFDAGDPMDSMAVVEIGVYFAGKLMVCKGFILDDSFGHSVDNASNYDFEFTGGWAKLE